MSGPHFIPAAIRVRVRDKVNAQCVIDGTMSLIEALAFDRINDLDLAIAEHEAQLRDLRKSRRTLERSRVSAAHTHRTINPHLGTSMEIPETNTSNGVDSG